MSPQSQSNALNPHVEECMLLHKSWGWFLTLGALMIIVGAMAIGSSQIAGLKTMLVFGWLLLVGGVVQIVDAFVAKCWRGFALHLMAGVLHVVVGSLMIQHPGTAAEFSTLVLAAMFMAGGLVRVIGAVAQSFPGRGWVFFNGLITLMLGISIWQRWPESSEWVIGLFVGIDLIFNGWTWVMLGLIVRRTGKAPSAA